MNWKIGGGKKPHWIEGGAYKIVSLPKKIEGWFSAASIRVRVHACMYCAHAHFFCMGKLHARKSCRPLTAADSNRILNSNAPAHAQLYACGWRWFAWRFARAHVRKHACRRLCSAGLEELLDSFSECEKICHIFGSTLPILRITVLVWIHTLSSIALAWSAHAENQKRGHASTPFFPEHDEYTIWSDEFKNGIYELKQWWIVELKNWRGKKTFIQFHSVQCTC